MRRLKRGVYRFIRFFVKAFYPKIEVVGTLPDGPCIAVGNHAKMHGPIAGELYFPGPHAIWCAGEMMQLKEVPAYAYRDFWAEKPKAVRWFYRLLSYLIAPFSVCIFNNARTIPVYKDRRVLDTFRATAKRLAAGTNVVIFPEHDLPHNHILHAFQEGFVDVARLYHRETGETMHFVPLYLAPALRKMVLGTPIAYRPEASIQEERKRISRALMAEITGMAEALPRHRVVPYPNLPKKAYPYSKQEEARP